MFGTGVGSLLWMLALTGVMIVEKTAPYGARLVAPLGGALVLAGVAVTVWPSRRLLMAPPRSDGAVDPGMAALLVAAAGLAILWPMVVAADSGTQVAVVLGGSRSAVPSATGEGIR